MCAEAPPQVACVWLGRSCFDFMPWILEQLSFSTTPCEGVESCMRVVALCSTRPDVFLFERDTLRLRHSASWHFGSRCMQLRRERHGQEHAAALSIGQDAICRGRLIKGLRFIMW